MTLKVRNALQGPSLWGRLGETRGSGFSAWLPRKAPGGGGGGCDVLVPGPHARPASRHRRRGGPGKVSPGASEAPGGRQCRLDLPQPTRLEATPFGRSQAQVRGSPTLRGARGEEEASAGGSGSWRREARPAPARSSPSPLLLRGDGPHPQFPAPAPRSCWCRMLSQGSTLTSRVTQGREPLRGGLRFGGSAGLGEGEEGDPEPDQSPRRRRNCRSDNVNHLGRVPAHRLFRGQ